MNTSNVLAENLRLLMAERGWSQAALAKRCGLSQQTISKALRCDASVTLDSLDKLAAAFGLAGHWLCIPVADWVTR